jgi:YesN/AraC family two-component response regulator
MVVFTRGSLTVSQPSGEVRQVDEITQSYYFDHSPDNPNASKEIKIFQKYPVKAEERLLASITDSDKPRAQKQLNELLGHILFCSGGDFDRMKAETYELLVLISRGAINAGVSASRAFGINYGFWREAQSIGGIDEFCTSLSHVIKQYLDCIFSLSQKKNINDINKAIRYIWQNYQKKITLEDAARSVYLSPAYFCKVFQRTIGCSFSVYLNRLRIEKSKQLLLRSDLRIADIVSMVGFEDQSYFTKVFKRVCGVSPTHFRKAIDESATDAGYVNVV